MNPHTKIIIALSCSIFGLGIGYVPVHTLLTSLYHQFGFIIMAMTWSGFGGGTVAVQYIVVRVGVVSCCLYGSICYLLFNLGVFIYSSLDLSSTWGYIVLIPLGLIQGIGIALYWTCSTMAIQQCAQQHDAHNNTNNHMLETQDMEQQHQALHPELEPIPVVDAKPSISPSLPIYQRYFFIAFQSSNIIGNLLTPSILKSSLPSSAIFIMATFCCGVACIAIVYMKYKWKQIIHTTQHISSSSRMITASNNDEISTRDDDPVNISSSSSSYVASVLRSLCSRVYMLSHDMYVLLLLMFLQGYNSGFLYGIYPIVMITSTMDEPSLSTYAMGIDNIGYVMAVMATCNVITISCITTWIHNNNNSTNIKTNTNHNSSNNNNHTTPSPHDATSPMMELQSLDTPIHKNEISNPLISDNGDEISIDQDHSTLNSISNTSYSWCSYNGVSRCVMILLFGILCETCVLFITLFIPRMDIISHPIVVILICVVIGMCESILQIIIPQIIQYIQQQQQQQQTNMTHLSSPHPTSSSSLFVIYYVCVSLGGTVSFLLGTSISYMAHVISLLIIMIIASMNMGYRWITTYIQHAHKHP